MTSEARTATNRRNAQKSTGPRTAEGKDRSSRNALKHGLTASKNCVIPGEDPDDYAQELQIWLDSCDDDPAQRALAERACRAQWQLRRLARADDARIAYQARHAVDAYELEQLAHAQQLGEKLLLDPQNRCAEEKLDPASQKVLDAWRAIDPAVVAAELQTSLAGLHWLKNRWQQLKTQLTEEEFWHYDSRYHATKLLGKRPEDVLMDTQVRDITLACLATHPNPWPTIYEVYQATTATRGRPVYFFRVELMERFRPKTPLDGFTYLMNLVDRELERLDALEPELAARAEADREQAALRALVDTSPEGALRMRYEAQLDRTMRGSIVELAKLRKLGSSRKSKSPPDDPAPPAAPEPAPQGPRPEPVAASEVVIGRAVTTEPEVEPGAGSPLAAVPPPLSTAVPSEALRDQGTQWIREWETLRNEPTTIEPPAPRARRDERLGRSEKADRRRE